MMTQTGPDARAFLAVLRLPDSFHVTRNIEAASTSEALSAAIAEARAWMRELRQADFDATVCCVDVLSTWPEPLAVSRAIVNVAAADSEC